MSETAELMKKLNEKATELDQQIGRLEATVLVTKWLVEYQDNIPTHCRQALLSRLDTLNGRHLG